MNTKAEAEPAGGSPGFRARNSGVIPRLAMALLVFIAFCALAATGAELIAAGRAAFGGDNAARATRSK